MTTTAQTRLELADKLEQMKSPHGDWRGYSLHTSERDMIIAALRAVPDASALEHGADGKFRPASLRTIIARAALSAIENPQGVETIDWEIADAVMRVLSDASAKPPRVWGDGFPATVCVPDASAVREALTAFVNSWDYNTCGWNHTSLHHALEKARAALAQLSADVKEKS